MCSIYEFTCHRGQECKANPVLNTFLPCLQVGSTWQILLQPSHALVNRTAQPLQLCIVNSPLLPAASVNDAIKIEPQQVGQLHNCRSNLKLLCMLVMLLGCTDTGQTHWTWHSPMLNILKHMAELQEEETRLAHAVMVSYAVSGSKSAPTNAQTSIRVWLGRGNGWSLPVPLARLTPEVWHCR